MEAQDNYRVYYFLGIGGIGMSALARYFKSRGATVCGYDRTATELTATLEAEGIAVHYRDEVSLIPPEVRDMEQEQVLVIFTPALPADSPELNWFRQQGYTVKKRSEVLGLITRQSRTLAVAGTHGKTTTSTMLAHIMKQSVLGCNAFLGGISANYRSNLLLDAHSDFTVVEADEFDRSFHTLSPFVSIITSADADHLDIYGDAGHLREAFELFAARTLPEGLLILKHGLPLAPPVNLRTLTYGLEPGADFYADGLYISDGNYFFDLHYTTPQKRGTITHLKLGMPGRHNVENAVAAAAAAMAAGVNEDELRAALASFLGVKRRFEYILRKPGLIFIDDYAHHPAELEACILSVREMFPGLPVTGIFQPHLFSRTRDFASEFSKSLSLLDQVVLLPIYPAREEPIAGIDSQLLLENISAPYKKLVEKTGLLNEIKSLRPRVLLTLGAGDIDALVQPIRLMLEEL